MDPPPFRSRGGFDKYHFYHWLGCKILALGDSTEVELLLPFKSEMSAVSRLVNGMEEKDRAKLAEIHFDGTGLFHLAVNLGKIECGSMFWKALGQGTTPLAVAALFGEVAVARYLLDHGANPNKTDEHGAVAMHSAVRSNEELIQLLLSRGARVDVAIPHGTPLHIAASYGMTGAVKILLEHNANPNSVSEVSGSPLVTALHSTEHGVNESDALEIVKLLVKAGADVNSGNPCPPLSVASRNGLIDCINYLLEAGANPDIADVRALELDCFDGTLYSNRSLCYLKTGRAQKALLDAEMCMRIRPDWVKGYYRKGAALMSLKEYEEAYDVFMDALEMDPGNTEIEKAMWEANAAMGGGDISDESQSSDGF
ncbi:hypothetical protein PR202_gb11418 [Eleusine coracana subsp. coracana]|uniref:Uncharacterized protein n=1 Tax=Eleusine coracana subsp. coracana TaxID=191504 RepID=A0AAV5EN92_ELECO|nr:hypothetical protein PR202_gb11418 [Eleusine coracana subsp. coracana]